MPSNDAPRTTANAQVLTRPTHILTSHILKLSLSRWRQVVIQQKLPSWRHQALCDLLKIGSKPPWGFLSPGWKSMLNLVSFSSVDYMELVGELDLDLTIVGDGARDILAAAF